MIDEDILQELEKIGGREELDEAYQADGGLGYNDYAANAKRVANGRPTFIRRQTFGSQAIFIADEERPADIIAAAIERRAAKAPNTGRRADDLEWRAQVLSSAAAQISSQLFADFRKDEGVDTIDDWRNETKGEKKKTLYEVGPIKSNTKTLLTEALSRYMEDGLIDEATETAWIEKFIENPAIYMFNMRFFAAALVWINLTYGKLFPDRDMAVDKDFKIDKDGVMRAIVQRARAEIGKTDVEIDSIEPSLSDYSTVFTYAAWLVYNSAGVYSDDYLMNGD
jgi:hypothetical protein